MPVTSKDNQWVKEWRGLCAEAKRRRESGHFAIEGARLCGDALASGVSIRTVLYTTAARETYAAVMDPLLAAAEQAVEISPEISRYMGDTNTPQGVFCVAKALDNLRSLDTIDIMGYYGALEDLQDPGNLGTVIRTAEALGLSGLLLSDGCCDIYNPKVLRASMGGVFRLPLWRCGGMTETVATLQKKGMTAFACVVDRDATPITEVAWTPGSVAVIGNEGNGLRPETVAACARRVTIPMAGRAESLNASIAASLVLWEMTRPGK